MSYVSNNCQEYYLYQQCLTVGGYKLGEKQYVPQTKSTRVLPLLYGSIHHTKRIIVQGIVIY